VCNPFPLCLTLITLRPPPQNRLPITIQLQLDNLTIRRTNSYRDTNPIDLLLRYTLNLNDPLLAVDGGDSAFAVFIGPAGDEDFVVFAEGD
jgi:hypothetical protein